MESLLVVALLTLTLAVGIFFYTLFASKLTAMRDSRSAAWQNVGKCGGGLSGGLLASPVALIDRLTDEDRIGRGDDLFTPGLANEVRSHTVEKPGILRTKTSPDRYVMTSESRVACNEQTLPEGDLISIFEWGFDEFIPAR